MVVRYQWQELKEGGDSEDDGDIVDKEITIEDDINVITIQQGFLVERTADGGIRMKLETQDEFAICNSIIEVILTKADLDRIKEFEQNGLI